MRWGNEGATGVVVTGSTGSWHAETDSTTSAIERSQRCIMVFSDEVSERRSDDDVLETRQLWTADELVRFLYLGVPWPNAIVTAREPTSGHREEPAMPRIAKLPLGHCQEYSGEMRTVAESDPRQIPADILLLASRQSGAGGHAGRSSRTQTRRQSADRSREVQTAPHPALGRRPPWSRLERAVVTHDRLVVDLKVDPRLDPLRKYPHFAALVRRLRFPP